MTKQIVLYRGEKFSTTVGSKSLFAKDVVKTGRWVHPATGQEIVFTPERIENLARNTAKYLAAGNRIPFPKGHTADPTKNLGYWPGPFIKHEDRLVGVVEPKDPVALEAIKAGTLDAVSVCIEFGIKDPKENVYDEVVTHVCATSYPVLDGQEGFLALSRDLEIPATDLFLPDSVKLSSGGSDVLETHDELAKELKARMKDHAKAHGSKGADHEDTKKAALKVQDAAHRLRKQSEIVHQHCNNATGGPTYMERQKKTYEAALRELASPVDADRYAEVLKELALKK